MGRPKRRQREIDQRRGDILDAAARVFAQKGFASASMQEIAAEVGYGASSLYVYFPNKQAILDALIESVVASTDDLFDVVVPAGSTLRQRLELLLHHQLAWIEARRDAVLFLAGHGTTMLAATSAGGDLLELIHGRTRAWLEANADPETLARVDATDAATALNGLAQAFFLRWVRSGGEGPPTRYASLVVDLFLGGLAGPDPTPRRSK